jgi:hypothetical protein
MFLIVHEHFELENVQVAMYMYNIDVCLYMQVTSSAKKKREPDSTRIHQTPEGAFYDLQRNAWQVR